MASHRKNRMARSPAAPYSGRMNNVATQTDTIVRACRRIEAAEAPPQLAELAREDTARGTDQAYYAVGIVWCPAELSFGVNNS